MQCTCRCHRFDALFCPPLTPCCSHWLSTEIEADIECLEVNSRPTPQKAAPAAQSLPMQQQERGSAAAGPSSSATASGWAAGGWDASCSSSEDEAEHGAQQAAQQSQPRSSQQQRRATPLLPGLPLVGGASPQQAPAAALEPAVVAAEQAALQQGQVHTLFDLASMDMSDLLAA